MKDLHWTPSHADNAGWKRRHLQTVQSHPVGLAIAAWLNYARVHQQRFESKIGDDYVLGDDWARWGYAMLGLLNGELGGMDAGTLDSIIRDNLAEQGFDADNEKRIK